MATKKRGIRLKSLTSDDEGLRELFESASERLVGRSRLAPIAPGVGGDLLQERVREALRQVTGDHESPPSPHPLPNGVSGAVNEAPPRAEEAEVGAAPAVERPARRLPVGGIRALRKELEATLKLLESDLSAREADGQRRLPFDAPDDQ